MSYFKRTLYIHTLSTMFLAVGLPAFAQSEYPPVVEMNVFAGGSRFFANQDTPEPRMILNDGVMGGVRGTWNINSWFGLEGAAQYGQNNLRLTPYYPGVTVAPFSAIRGSSPGGGGEDGNGNGNGGNGGNGGDGGIPIPPGPIGPGDLTPDGVVFPSSVRFASHTGIASFGPVFYLLPRATRFRVHVKAAPAAFWFKPTQTAKETARAPYNSFLGAANLQENVNFGGVLGLGFKASFSRHFGFRADWETGIMYQPHFKLPTYPVGPGAVFIPEGGYGTMHMITGGFYFAFGGGPEAVAAALPPADQPAPTPPPPPPAPTLTVQSPAARSVNACPGDITMPIDLSIMAMTNLEGHMPIYRWTVNGMPVGMNQPQFAFMVPDMAGAYRVGVTVSDDPAQSADTRTAVAVTRELLVVNVAEYMPPTITGSAAQSQIDADGQTALTITPMGNDCNRQMTYTCTAPEGTLSGNPPNVFSAMGVTFEPDRSRVQTKVVNISCTVTDARGGTGMTTIPVTVSLPALQSTRLDDLIFANGSARVNNCGKRILLDELYPQLTQHPDWDVVLVAHTAPGEPGTQLDRRRVLNVIANLTAGTDTCQMLEPSRIQYSVAGSNQVSDPRPGFCGTTTRDPADERPGQDVSQNDPNAAFRRVEVYLVPRGAAVPPGAAPLQSVPLAEVQALGCPL